jgi:transposase-like protein
MSILARIKEQISLLSFEEQYLLVEHLSLQQDIQKQDILQRLSAQVEFCPHCKSSKIIKWCKYKDTNRFKCKKCAKTFIPNTGTAVHWLKKPSAFIDYAVVMFSEGFNSLKSQSKRVGVSARTAFDWRHRILTALGSEAPDFKGLTEMDDIWFRYSQKGRQGLKYSRKRGRSSHKGDNNFQAKVLITKDRGAGLDMSLLKIGRLSRKDISGKLSGKFKETATLISDKHPSIKSFSNSEHINHKSFIAKHHTKDETYHIQTVNNLAGSLKAGVNYCLRGVSTKYLQNYASWFAVKEKYKNHKDKVRSIIIDCISNTKAWDMFTNIEKLYEQFILNHSVRTYRCPTKRTWKYQNWNFENAKSGSFI